MGREEKPGRARWAASRLPLFEGCRVLEIGFGDGAALAALAQHSAPGILCGMDPSPAACEQAGARNREAIGTGRLRLVQGTIEAFDAPPASFDLIFAVNVNLYWLDVQAALPRIATLLAPAGRLHLFYETPAVNRLQDVMDRISARLSAGGFSTLSTHNEPSPGFHRIHIVAGPA